MSVRNLIPLTVGLSAQMMEKSLGYKSIASNRLGRFSTNVGKGKYPPLHSNLTRPRTHYRNVTLREYGHGKTTSLIYTASA